MRDRPRVSARIANEIGLEPDSVEAWITFLVALHDIGKFSYRFQLLAPDANDVLQPDRSIQKRPYNVRHDALGYYLWDRKLSEAALELEMLDPFERIERAERHKPALLAVTGHHGRPPKTGFSKSEFNQQFQSEDVGASFQFMKRVHEILGADGIDSMLMGEFSAEGMRRASWQLAGLTVLADWLGSNRDFFPLRSEPMELDEYWKSVAIPQAQRAVTETGMRRATPSSRTGLRALFDFEPTPLQEYASTTPIADGPQLFIMEDATGSGKTEAAITLAHRCMNRGLADGLYVGLPTTATANQMYERVAGAYRRLYSDSSDVSMVLAHGSRDLSAEFQKSIDLQDQSVGAQAGSTETSEKSGTAGSAYCRAWLVTAGRRLFWPISGSVQSIRHCSASCLRAIRVCG